jgi:hypothetical protein
MSNRQSLPNSEDFVVQLVGDTTGTDWTGKFTAKKRLSFNDQLRRDLLRRQMLGTAEAKPSDRAASMADVFSELMVRLVTSPSWWTDNDEGRELSDENVIVEVYKKALEVEQKALEALQKKATEAKEDLAKAVSDEPAIK